MEQEQPQQEQPDPSQRELEEEARDARAQAVRDAAAEAFAGYWRQKTAEPRPSPEFVCVNGIVLSARNIEYVDFQTRGVAHVHFSSGRMRSFDEPREVAGLAGLFGLGLVPAPPDEPLPSEVN